MLSNLTICLVVDEGDGGATAVTIHSVARFGSRNSRVWGLSGKGLARPLSVADNCDAFGSTLLIRGIVVGPSSL